MTETKKPVLKVRVGNVSCAVWGNTGKTKEGKEFEFDTIQLEKSYKDSEGEWQSQKASLRVNEAHAAVVALQEVIRNRTVKTE